MINRIMEKKVELVPNVNNLEFFTPMKLEYYLTESTIENVDNIELSGIKHYGIEIIKKVDGMADEMQAVRSLSSRMETTHAIFEKIAENTVTPVSLFDILDDIVGI